MSSANRTLSAGNVPGDDPAVVVDIEAGREAAAFSRGPVVHQRVAIRVADVRVLRKQHRAVFARVLREARLNTVLPSPRQVVACTDARDEARCADRVDVAGRVARDVLEAHPEVQRQIRRSGPAILHVGGAVFRLNSAPRCGNPALHARQRRARTAESDGRRRRAPAPAASIDWKSDMNT